MITNELISEKKRLRAIIDRNEEIIPKIEPVVNNKLIKSISFSLEPDLTGKSMVIELYTSVDGKKQTIDFDGSKMNTAFYEAMTVILNRAIEYSKQDQIDFNKVIDDLKIALEAEKIATDE